MVTLVEAIIKKKELQGIQKEFVEKHLQEYFTKNPRVKQKYVEDKEKFLTTKEYIKLQKTIREQLRKVYGVFFTHKYQTKKEQYVQELINNDTQENRELLLKLHRSTTERLPYYQRLYTELFSHIEKPTSVLDIGCGFNPFAHTYIPVDVTYHSADIACDDQKLIENYFQARNIPHSTRCLDLSEESAIDKLPQVDVVFAFKVFDSLEDKHYGIAQKYLEALKGKYLIASFPTKSIGQKKTLKNRTWFEKMIEKQLITTYELENEIFYVITLNERNKVTQEEQ